MPIQKFEDILPEEVYEHTIGTAEYLLSLGGNEFCTNRWWDFGIRKDSFPVFVHNIYQNSELHNSLKKIIEEKTQKSVYDNNIMLYYWTRYSYIPWHNDNVKYEDDVDKYLLPNDQKINEENVENFLKDFQEKKLENLREHVLNPGDVTRDPGT